MIDCNPEFLYFIAEPEIEIEPFDIKQTEEIFLNHPFKILLFYLRKHLPYGSFFSEVDISDFYFSLLDDYNRYGIAFERKKNLFPDNCLYVIENNISKKEKGDLHFISKYDLLYYNNYNKKTLLSNNVKKIDLNKYDKGEKPLSKLEKEKRDCIKQQENKYLQIAMMEPNFYNNDKLFKELIFSQFDDYSGEFMTYSSLMYTDKKYDRYFKKTFKKQIDMIKKINYLIEKGNSKYLGIIDSRSTPRKTFLQNIFK